MTKIEYLSLSGPQRLVKSVQVGFASIPKRFARFFARVPRAFYRFGSAVATPFAKIWECLRYGNWDTRLSTVVWGLGQMTRHQVIRGVFYLLYEVFFVIFMALIGGHNLAALGSLGQLGEMTMIVGTVRVSYYYDDSFTILIYSVVSIVFIGIALFLWYTQLKDSMTLQRMGYIGRRASDRQTLGNVFDKSYDKTLLSIPVAGLAIFTIIPTTVMILIGFTNYNSSHYTPKALIDWVGLANFARIFGGSSTSNASLFVYAFGMVLLWTLVWAFFATFSNYFLGMGVAMMINAKGIRFKKVWRTILITTIAVPQFISLLLMNRMLNQDMGIFNQWLTQLHWISSGIPWLNSPILTKVVIIVVNTWIGIPYTMLICTGLLMNIPKDLYESARIDGAGAWKAYTKITLPYMLFVTTPYLISQFVGNINNFNVIYLLSQGNPLFTFTGNVPYQVNGVGQTDLLITWIYKLSLTNVDKDFGYASVLGLLIFMVVAFFSLIVFNRSSSFKNEEEFQ